MVKKILIFVLVLTLFLVVMVCGCEPKGETPDGGGQDIDTEITPGDNELPLVSKNSLAAGRSLHTAFFRSIWMTISGRRGKWHWLLAFPY